MNLQVKHLPLLLLGALLGAGSGWLVSVVAASSTGLSPESGLMFGSVAGAGAAVLLIVVLAARDPNAAPAGNFTRINGTGSALFGRSEPRPDGSYVATEWFTILFVPIFPVCRYRVIPHPRGSFVHRTYTILEKSPPRLADAGKVYGLMAIIAIAILVYAYFQLR